jgi:SAM-dependent methyltransferase
MGELKDKASHYSQAFGGAGPLADEANRLRKAEKIRAVLEQEGILPDPDLRVLDIGCSFGIILKSLSSYVGYGVGIDIDRQLLSSGADKVSFVRADGEHLPFAAGSFDIVICNHVYEHTDDPEKMFSEIERVLTADGVCYFAGPNKYDLIEPHYGLPFLSWLPRSLADWYLKCTRKGERYAERPYSYAGITRLLNRFEATSYTEKILGDPARYRATDILPPRSLKRLVAIALFRFAPFFFPGFVFLLRKSARS